MDDDASDDDGGNDGGGNDDGGNDEGDGQDNEEGDEEGDEEGNNEDEDEANDEEDDDEGDDDGDEDMDLGGNEWITLPGPAEWWPEDYDFIKHGFDTPLRDDGHQAAFFMLFARDKPAEFELVLPAHLELRVLPNTLESRRLISRL